MWQLPVRLSLRTMVLGLALILGTGMMGWWYAGGTNREVASYALRLDEPPVVLAQPVGGPAAPLAPVTPLSFSQTPVAKPAVPGPAVNPVPLSATRPLTTGGIFSWPLVAEVSSYYGPRWGRFHAGIDLAANMGDSIKASRDGVVTLAGEVTDYGLTVIIRHPDGTSTLYGHSSKLLVNKGQKVKRGEVIALVGSTGRSTGPHLHFEIRVNDQARDPLEYLP